MTPAARIAAAIELLDEIESDLGWNQKPADARISVFFRNRRYAGAKDRRSVAERVWRILRYRGRLSWLLGQAGGNDTSSRHLVIADLACFGEHNAEQIDNLFSDGKYGPGTLDDAEKSLIGRFENRLKIEAPTWAHLSYPAWLHDMLLSRFDSGLEAQMTAFLDRAPLDLRVNTLAASTRAVREELCALGLAAKEGSFAPACLRLDEGAPLSGFNAYKQGHIEVQDEGAQIAALLADTQPGQQVVDLCAGGGGKTLAVAAQMSNKGQIYAFDIDEKRLRPLKKRAQKAGVRNLQIRLIAADETLDDLHGRADRVILDVPCSGSGTWRRAPDLKWRLAPPDLDDLSATQDALLARGAALVKPGGRLIYITCSVLIGENEERIRRFLQEFDEFDLVPFQEPWQEHVDLMPPESSTSQIEECIQLTPHDHGTDGFFIAILVRSEA